MSLSIERTFPNLGSTGYHITSLDTPEYNCIAWAAGVDNQWWWPDSNYESYWHPEAPRIETLEAFTELYGILGYSPCPNSEYEEGYEKVAIYVDAYGKPTHAARMLPSGKWTSKLGRLEDIEHDVLEGLNGRLYGSVAQVLRRPLI